jgi:hypothetical protein
MKKLSEQFDNLPQDFDREAIWSGIEKPKPLFFFRPSFMATFLAGTAAALLFVFNPLKPTPHQPNATESVEVTAANTMPTLSTSHLEGSATNPIPTNPTKESIAASFSTAEATPTYQEETGFSSEMVQKNAELRSETEGAANANTPVNKSLTPALPIQPSAPKQLPSISATSFSANSDLAGRLSPAPPQIKPAPRHGKHRLALRGGVGFHTIHFSTNNETDPAWRNQLEKTQLDYSLGLRYEYAFEQNFLLSLTASYQLIKDQIQTEYIRQTPLQDYLINYQLHNHYHLFSGSLELGKRFYQKRFFWDVQGGVGITLHQISEVDFFVGEGELADEIQIANTYPAAPAKDVFFTGQAAIGKHLNSRLFARTGVQIQSARDLASPQEGIRHRIVPFQVFMEVGYRF